MARASATITSANGQVVKAGVAASVAVEAESSNTPREQLKTLISQLNDKYLEREPVIRGLVSALLTGANVFIGGPPGTAKTDLAKDLIRAFLGRSFYYLLGADTRVDELLGAVDLAALDKNEFKRNLSGKLADSELVILDEIFKGGSAVLNTLLGAILDKQVVNGMSTVDIPLISAIGLSNELPDDEDGKLKAFWSRIPLRFWVDYVSPRNLKTLRMRYAGLKPMPSITVQLSLQDLAAMQQEVKQVRVTEGIIDLLSVVEKALQDQAIRQSDRTAISFILRILQANAYISGRNIVTEDDIEILKHVYWDDLDQKAIVVKVIDQALEEVSKELDEMKEQVRQILDNVRNRCNGVTPTQEKLYLYPAQNKVAEIAARLQAVVDNTTQDSKRGQKARQTLRQVNSWVKSEIVGRLADLESA